MALDIRLRAERRVGEMLMETLQHEGGTVARHDSRHPSDITCDNSSR